MKFYQRPAVTADLQDYCHLAKPHSFCEVCEWHNGEGWDIQIDDKHLSLTYGELEAIMVLAKIKHPKEE